jgi:hypothetical protein
MDGRRPRQRVQNPAYRSTRPSHPCSGRSTGCLTCRHKRSSLIVVGHRWASFAGPATAQTAQRRPRVDARLDDRPRPGVVLVVSNVEQTCRWSASSTRGFRVRRLVVVCVVMSALALMACSGPETGGTATNLSSSAPPAASPSELVATVQQYAGVVNSSMKEIRDTWQKYQAEGCHIGVSSLPCKLMPMTLDTLAQTLAIKLTSAAKPGIPAYIGKPPSEIEKLVTNTMSAVQAVDASIDESGQPAAGMSFAVNDLMDVLDRWDPYI